MEIFQNTVDALQKESNTVQSSIVNNTEITIRRKIMELNLWLLTAFILDFITLPPAQPSGRESMSRNPMLMNMMSPVDIVSNMPDFSHFMVSPVLSSSPANSKRPSNADNHADLNASYSSPKGRLPIHYSPLRQVLPAEAAFL